jgi:hypothetical protein
MNPNPFLLTDQCDEKMRRPGAVVSTTAPGPWLCCLCQDVGSSRIQRPDHRIRRPDRYQLVGQPDSAAPARVDHRNSRKVPAPSRCRHWAHSQQAMSAHAFVSSDESSFGAASSASSTQPTSVASPTLPLPFGSMSYISKRLANLLVTWA